MNLFTLTYLCKMISFCHTMNSLRHYRVLAQQPNKSLETQELLNELPPKAA